MALSVIEEPRIVETDSSPARYLEAVLNRVNLEDCLTLMEQLPSGCAQMVFADPPFNLD